MIARIFLLITALLLGSCGQTGKLYLPESAAKSGAQLEAPSGQASEPNPEQQESDEKADKPQSSTTES